jgi:hypothetical protein
MNIPRNSSVFCVWMNISRDSSVFCIWMNIPRDSSVFGWIFQGIVLYSVFGWIFQGIVLYSVFGWIFQGIVLYSVFGWIFQISIYTYSICIKNQYVLKLKPDVSTLRGNKNLLCEYSELHRLLIKTLLIFVRKHGVPFCKQLKSWGVQEQIKQEITWQDSEYVKGDGDKKTKIRGLSPRANYTHRRERKFCDTCIHQLIMIILTYFLLYNFFNLPNTSGHTRP